MEGRIKDMKALDLNLGTKFALKKAGNHDEVQTVTLTKKITLTLHLSINEVNYLEEYVHTV